MKGITLICKNNKIHRYKKISLITFLPHHVLQAVTQFTAPKDGRDHRPKHVELIGIINKPLLLHLVGVYVTYFNRYDKLLYDRMLDK